MPDQQSFVPRPRVVVVAQAAPALGGIASFAHLLTSNSAFLEMAEVSLLNTTRQAVRTAGRATAANLINAVVDTSRVYRAARQADVVHLQSAPGRLLPLLRMLALGSAARLGRARVLCHVHSGRINGGNPEGFRPSRTFRLVLSRMTFVDAFLTVSRAGAEALRPLVPAHVPVEWLDNAVPMADAASATPGGEPVTVLFVGTLSRRKGLMELAEATADLRTNQPDGWSLVVVGGAAEVGEEEANEIRRAFHDRGLEACLVGSQTPDEVRTRMAEAGVFVLPSHWEGQPMAILEAMACGLPIVSTTVGAIPDVVRDGVDGLLVAPYDAPALREVLRRVVTDPALRERLGASARARAAASYDAPVLARRLAPFWGATASAASVTT